MEEYKTRVLSSELTWFKNGDLISNPEFSANMEVMQRGINENYVDIQDLQRQSENFVEIEDIVAGKNISITKENKVVTVSANINAKTIPVVDEAGYYNSKNVEEILQELGYLIYSAIQAQSEVIA